MKLSAGLAPIADIFKSMIISKCSPSALFWITLLFTAANVTQVSARHSQIIASQWSAVLSLLAVNFVWGWLEKYFVGSLF